MTNTIEYLPSLGELIGGIAAFMTALFTGMKILIAMSNKPIHRKIDAIKNETTKQFCKIARTLAIVEDLTLKKSVIEALRAAVRGYIYYNKNVDNRTKILIDSQCERIVEIAEDVMNEEFTKELVEQTALKVETAANRARQQVLELFGDDFLKYYIVIQQNGINDFMKDLHQLADDHIVNSKYIRFKSACERFLHYLVSETLILSHKWEHVNKNNLKDGS